MQPVLAPRPPRGLGCSLRRLTRALLVLCAAAALLWSAPAGADDMPPNVDRAAHRWLERHMPQALRTLIQSRHGAVDREHIHVVDGLGTWGAGRSRGQHQGTDFVLDLPHEDDGERLHVGSLLDGKVVHLEKHWGAYGNTIFIYRDAAPRMVFVFAHLEEVSVRVGQQVRVGDRLGVFGCTGNCRGLRGRHLRHQVHVEIYALPDSFRPSQIDWEHLPMGQLRRAALHNARGHGVNVAAYAGAYRLSIIERDDLQERYRRNRANGGLKGYLERQREQTASR